MKNKQETPKSKTVVKKTVMPKKAIVVKKQYTPTAKEKQNLKDAVNNVNMRPTGPNVGRVKPTLGGAKYGKTIKKK